MPTRYNNMNMPDPHRRPQESEKMQGRAVQGNGPGKTSVSQTSERVMGTGRSQDPKNARQGVRKSQTLDDAKRQAYTTPKSIYLTGSYNRSYQSAQDRGSSQYYQKEMPRQRTQANDYYQDNRYASNQSNRPASPQKPHPAKSPVQGKRKISPEQKKRRSIFLGIVAAVILILVLCWCNQYYRPVITRGVYINNIDMSGLRRDAAVGLLEQQLEDMRDSIAVTLKYEDKTWVLTRDDFSVEAPIEHTVDLALKVAREGSVFQRIADSWDARKDMPHFETDISISDGGMGEHIAGIAEELDIKAVNATMTFNPDGGDFIFEEGVAGYQMDQERIKEAVLQALESKYMVSTIEFGLEQTEPEVKKEDLAKATSRIAFFETKVTGSQNRIDNVRLALSQFNGMVVAPGETVSFNKTTGERSAENGYKEAPGINADKGLEDTLGGGVCQASTTLYNAVLMANCAIVERHRHSFPSSYVKEGFDAMVNWSTDDDLQFTNTSDMPLYIRTYVGKHDDGSTYAQVWIYGKKLADGITLSRKNVIVKEIEKPEPELIKDTEGKYANYVTYNDEAYIAVASRKGLTVEAYLVTKDASGNVIKEELMHTDYYSAITGKHYYGTQKRPEDVPLTTQPGCYLLPNAKTEQEESESPD